MALIGVNQPRAQQKETTMDKILKGVGIARGLLGTGLAIPKFIQEQRESKAGLEAQERGLGLKEKAGERADVETDLKVETLTRPMTDEDRAKGVGPLSLPERHGERVLREPTVDPLKQAQIKKIYQELDQPKLSDFDQQMFAGLQKDFQIAHPDTPGAQNFNIGGKTVYMVPREESEDKTEIEKRADKLRQEFTKQSGEFIGQTSAMQRVEDSAKDPSAAGDLALIFNFMKILDPGSTVREGEFATAQNSAGIPDRIRARYNQVVDGERLGETQRADFLNRAQRLYKGAQNLQKNRVQFYTELANERDLPVEQVVRDLGIRVPGAKQTIDQKSAQDMTDDELLNAAKGL